MGYQRALKSLKSTRNRGVFGVFGEAYRARRDQTINDIRTIQKTLLAKKTRGYRKSAYKGASTSIGVGRANVRIRGSFKR